LVYVAVNVTEAPEQMVLPGLAETATVGTTVEFTVTVMPELVAVAGEAQVALLVSTHVTTSLLARLVVVNVGLLLPVFEPFTFHWYDGEEPPFVGVAVKATEVPEQIVLPDPELTLTEGVTTALTVIVMLLLVAGLVQPRLLVITQVTTLPFASELVLYVEPPLPTLLPFTFHW
jgi:hypothetical protein